MDFPNDADGDALRRVAHSDMSKPMDIDFAVDVPNETAGSEVAHLAGDRGYATRVDFDDESRRWTCYCTKRMVATYRAVVAAQEELDALSAPVGGRSDGWGTFGNGTELQRRSVELIRCQRVHAEASRVHAKAAGKYL